MNAPVLRSFLKDVLLSGVGVISTRKLLWLIGWGQDRPGAWRDLLDHWKEVGGEPGALRGLEINDMIVLTTGSEIEPVSKWANET
ncbi:MAG: hypothetical protein WAU68_04080 [Vitreimonas sp.]